MGVLKTLKSLGSALRPGEESAEIRRFLSDAYNTLADINMAESYNSYNLDEAISLYLEELDGTPATGRPSKSAKLTALLSQVNARVAQASQMEVESLGDDVVSGQSFAQIGGLLPSIGHLSLPDTLPDSPVDIGSLPMPDSPSVTMAGSKIQKAKDTLL